jgi:hypothetical protein
MLANNAGFTGLLPKAIISMYLCFFPVTIGMVKGLRSPDPLQLDLMRTYSASPAQVLWKLRWPAATTFLFARNEFDNGTGTSRIYRFVIVPRQVHTDDGNLDTWRYNYA